MNLKTDILKYKSSHRPSINEIQKLKKQAVVHEDWIFRKLKCKDYCSSRKGFHKADNVYGQGVQRVTEYFPTVGFYKYKANWFTKHNYELNL